MPKALGTQSGVGHVPAILEFTICCGRQGRDRPTMIGQRWWHRQSAPGHAEGGTCSSGCSEEGFTEEVTFEQAL